MSENSIHEKMRTPVLRAPGERPEEYRFFCYDAGLLETKNAAWRSVTPVIEESSCVGCGRCCLYCPDGVIRLEEKKAVIDYDFCKGCGICSRECRVGAITMKAGGEP